MWTTLDSFQVDYERAFLEHVNSSPENIQAVQETQSAVSLEIDDTTRLCQSSIQEKTQVIQERKRSTSFESGDTLPLSQSCPERAQAVQECQSDETTPLSVSSSPEKTQVIKEPQRLTIYICEGDDTTPLSRSSSPENIQETQSSASLESDGTTPLSQSSSPENI